jgi:hypothetical protein
MRSYFLILFSFISFMAFGQQDSVFIKNIKGIVYSIRTSNITKLANGKTIQNKASDSAGKQPQPFVDITIEGTNTSAQSNIDGKFQIDIPSELIGKKITLNFSSPGWVSQHIVVGATESSTPLEVILKGATGF